MDFNTKFEKTVKNTIKEYKLFTKKDNILVACSGGKDSTVALYLLNKWGYNVEGLIVDLEIGKYSQTNLDNTINFCKEHDIKLNVVSFREDFGYNKCKIEAILKSKGTTLNSCSICGVLRRYMLNKKSREMGFDKIVTGHNLDDEAQAIMMNFLRNTMNLQSRLGPISGNIKDKRFIPRVKPLYFCLEDDIRKYSKSKGFVVLYDRCPCIVDSFRNKIRCIMNDLSNDSKVKKTIVKNFIKMLPKLKKDKKNTKELLSCSNCDEPTTEKTCTTCKILERLNS
jgi:uncharacterized protein (TIGR00269 family)